MKNKYCLLAISLLLTFISPPETLAQAIEGCALSRLQSAARMALASPQHVKIMNQYDMTFYGLDLQMERNSIFISGTVTLKAKLNGTRLDTFAFELHPNFLIESVLINGIPQPAVIRNGSDIAVKLTNPIQAPNTVTAAITYSGSAPQQASAAIGSGFSTATELTWGNQVTWSLSEPYAALEWWPTKQVLTDKADSVHVFVTTSAENKVGSNGLLTRTVDLPNGKKRHEWKSTYPIAYYLVSVAVSDYEEYLIFANPDGATAPVPILNYVYSGGALDRFKSEIDLTAPLLEYYSSTFTLYPFAKEKYGHSMAPMGGGMEHQTMTTQSTFTFTLTAHELAHQWFGDNVTCASWEDIWLNEGFASYTEFLALQQLRPQSAAAWMENTHSIALRSPNGTVRVADTTNVSRIFDYSLTYKKGASVVHMLRFHVNNDALFFQALQNYQQQFGDSTANTSDLKRVYEETTGINLDLFFEQWYAGAGFPVFAIEWNKTGSTLTLQSSQTASGSTGFFKTDVEYLIQTTVGDQLVRVTQDQPQQTYTFEIEGDVVTIIVDPDNWLLKEVTSVKRNILLAFDNELLEQPVIYPNPVGSESLKIQNLPFAATEAIIYDRIGRQVWQGKVQREQNISLPTKNLPAGLYLIHLSNGKESYRTNFIKVD